MVLESTCTTQTLCTTLKTLYTRLKIFFKADLSTNTTHLHDGVTLILVFFKFGNPREISRNLYKKEKP